MCICATHRESGENHVGYRYSALEKKYKNLLEIAPNPIYLVDLKGKILEVNRAAEKMLDYGEGELEGLHVWDIDKDESKHELIKNQHKKPYSESSSI